MDLRELLQETEVVASSENLALDILALAYDTREISPAALFVAIPGFKIDGHEFIQEAFQRKAVATIIENSKYRSQKYPWIQVPSSRRALADLSCTFYGHPSRYLNLIGITGTNGKTTTANLIASILEDTGHLTGLVGTIQNRLGGQSFPVSHTTPESLDLQKLLRYFLAHKAAYGVLEVSSHALELQRVHKTEFDIVVFTNLSPEHLDFHQNMENYLAAKGKLFSDIGYQVHKKRKKFAILNVDDPYSQYLAELTRVPLITYGLQNNADVRAQEVQVTAGGTRFILKYTNQEIPVKLKLTGKFNVYNALAAIAVGLVEGIAIEKIVATLENVKGIPGRFERVNCGQKYPVIVDYSHTPDSLANCLKTIAEFSSGRIITVFGCGGDRDQTKRALMGEIAGRYSDICFITSDNPRSEDPEKIMAEIIPGVAKGAQGKPFHSIVDRREAIQRAIGEAGPADIVLIAGKGHEEYQFIGSQVIPFSDRAVATEILQQTGKWGD